MLRLRGSPTPTVLCVGGLGRRVGIRGPVAVDRQGLVLEPTGMDDDGLRVWDVGALVADRVCTGFLPAANLLGSLQGRGPLSVAWWALCLDGRRVLDPLAL